MTDMLHFVFAEDPVPGLRPRTRVVPTSKGTKLIARARTARSVRDVLALVNAQIYTPKEVQVWKKRAEEQMRKVRDEAIGQRPIVKKGLPIEVFLLVVFELPKSDRRKSFQVQRAWHPKANGDWDNLGKPPCDAANGVLWDDDCQVVRACVEKITGADGEPPRVEMIVRPLIDPPHLTMFESVLQGRPAVDPLGPLFQQGG